MYVADRLKLVYLAVPRTATRATSQYLMEEHGARLEGKNHPPGGHHGVNLPVLEECLAMGYRSVAVVRNPWDWMVSWWHHGQHWLRTNGWKEYIRAWPVSEMNRYHKKGRPFAHWTDVATDVIRYEDLEDELERIIGCDVILPLVGASEDRKDYQTYYDDEDREFVANWCASEIEEYGYEFENGIA